MILPGDTWTDGNRRYLVLWADEWIVCYADQYQDGESEVREGSAILWEIEAETGEVWKDD